MPVAARAVCLAIITFLWTAPCVSKVSAEVVVSCVVMETCVLPCRFQAGAQEVIHWIHLSPVEANVHSYYYQQDRFAHQNESFRGRTSLIKDKISTGDASLLLSRVQVQDWGRYKCYTSTISGNQDTYILLKVQAPVSKVDIEQEGNTITCSSDGIYPKPALSWSSRPETTLSPPNTTFQETPQGLIIIRSTLTINGSVGDLIYICTISSQEISRSATVRNLPSINGSSHTDTTIPCMDSNDIVTSFNLTWRFNHAETILTQTDGVVHYEDQKQWEKHVKEVSSSGSLILKHEVQHEGIFTCELRNAEGTFVSNTLVKINTEKQTPSPGAIVGIVIGVVFFCSVIIRLLIYCKKKRRDSVV